MPSVVANERLSWDWEMYTESIPTFEQLENKATNPLELFNLTKDTTDYAWYSMM